MKNKVASSLFLALIALSISACSPTPSDASSGIHVPDIDNYDQNRGFYYPLEETPFPICRSNEELEEAVLGFDTEKYEKRTEEYLKARGCIDDGKASERIVDMLEGIVCTEKIDK